MIHLITNTIAIYFECYFSSLEDTNPKNMKFLLIFHNSGVQGKNNEYHNVNKGQNSFIDTLIFDLIDNVVFVVFALYSRIFQNSECFRKPLKTPKISLKQRLEPVLAKEPIES
jgi:hypothetical protein